MSKTVVSCDLDDTLAPDQVHYEQAKQELAELIQEHKSDMIKKDIIDYLDNIDMKNYEKMGVTKTRFARSCHQTALDLVGEEIVREAWNIGRSVFMNTEQYRSIGTFDGFDELVNVIEDSHHTVVVTAGVKDIQKRKVDGTGLREHFDDIEIVTSGSKENVLSDLESEYDSVVHIGNSVRSDIKPAQRVGINAIHVNTNDWLAEKDDNKPNVWSVDCLSECANILQSEFL